MKKMALIITIVIMITVMEQMVIMCQMQLIHISKVEKRRCLMKRLLKDCVLLLALVIQIVNIQKSRKLVKGMHSAFSTLA